MSDEPTPGSPTSESLAFRAALLVGLLVLLFAASAAYLLYARGVFEPSQRLVLLSDDAEGVTVGMDITFAGSPIGRVRGIELSADGTTRTRARMHWPRFGRGSLTPSSAARPGAP